MEGALQRYSITEESLPLQKLLTKYDTRLHWFVRAACVCVFVSFMATFTLYSFFKVIRGRAYVEMHSEDRPWNGEGTLPRVALANVRIPSNYSIQVLHVSIPNGDYNAKQTRKVT